MFKNIITLIAAFASFAVMSDLSANINEAEALHQVSDVKIYSSDNCGPCLELKKSLKNLGIKDGFEYVAYNGETRYVNIEIVDVTDTSYEEDVKLGKLTDYVPEIHLIDNGKTLFAGAMSRYYGLDEDLQERRVIEYLINSGYTETYLQEVEEFDDELTSLITRFYDEQDDTVQGVLTSSIYVIDRVEGDTLDLFMKSMSDN
ncbi:MAG: hypothetical protein DIZ80_00135 [endosymbiont of Galathealinum brachiosum]|uniref:Glutaredoxin domain-containing protein n=1 Tax=endosymbiont of Galathealinum brachiosum TaxID=2200906 RepID=A0A370DMX3_9GAMM|nr:MAG: hypothetical protein DIZ80_00135 [endosymbiont of Galathealinum brachiosum]